MKKTSLKSLLVLILSIFAFPVFAENIQSLNATPDGNFLEFSWDPIDNSGIDQETHYALQWNENLSKIRIDEDTSALTSMSNSYYRMLGNTIFEKNKDYYARVYTYYREDRQTHLLKGSKILKFKWLYTGNMEISYIDPNDPIVIEDEATTTIAQEFNHLAASPYDTSVQLSWSNVNEVFDKYAFVLSENYDLSDPVAEIEVDTNYQKALLTNLEPNKKYYIAGYLKRNGSNFGKGETINFTTLSKFDTNKQSRFVKYILAKKRYGMLVDTELNTDEINETTSTESITTTVPTTDSAIKARISELKRLISKYNLELRQLEAKVTTTTATSSSSSSLRDRLKNWRSYR